MFGYPIHFLAIQTPTPFITQCKKPRHGSQYKSNDDLVARPWEVFIALRNSGSLGEKDWRFISYDRQAHFIFIFVPHLFATKIYVKWRAEGTHNDQNRSMDMNWSLVLYFRGIHRHVLRHIKMVPPLLFPRIDFAPDSTSVDESVAISVTLVRKIKVQRRQQTGPFCAQRFDLPAGAAYLRF